MNGHDRDKVNSVAYDQSLRPNKSKSPEVSSKFLSPNSPLSSDHGISSPNCAVSQSRRKSVSISSSDQRKHMSDEESGAYRGPLLWPSSSSGPISSEKGSNSGTLADHLGNDRLQDFLERNSYEKNKNGSSDFALNRQGSCNEMSRFENEKERSKENHRPVALGGSMRYTRKMIFPATSNSSSSSSSSWKLKPNDLRTVPGRLSLDENTLDLKSLRRKFNSVRDSVSLESDCSDAGTDCSSPSSGRSPLSSRRSAIELSSNYTNDLSTKPHREASESNISRSLSSDKSSLKKFKVQNTIKRVHSLNGYKSSTSQWAMSPGRTGSPPMSVENKGKIMSFSSMKPPTSPSKTKGMEKILNLGLDFLKGKRSSSALSSPPSRFSIEDAHELRLLDNRLMQWRYANGKAMAVNARAAHQAESNLLCSWDSLTKLQFSVQHKKLQYEKQKLVMKLNFILCSQMKLLEPWGAIEWQFESAISKTKECLHSAVCRVPLVEGAKVDTTIASIIIRRTSQVEASLQSMIYDLSPLAEKTASLLSELAEVVAQEKLLLQECLELIRHICAIELEERSLCCNIIQLELWHQQFQLQSQEESKGRFCSMGKE